MRLAESRDALEPLVAVSKALTIAVALNRSVFDSRLPVSSKKIAGHGDRPLQILAYSARFLFRNSASFNQHAFSMPFSPESWPFIARLERPSKRESPMFSGKIGRGERI